MGFVSTVEEFQRAWQSESGPALAVPRAATASDDPPLAEWSRHLDDLARSSQSMRGTLAKLTAGANEGIELGEVEDARAAIELLEHVEKTTVDARRREQRGVARMRTQLARAKLHPDAPSLSAELERLVTRSREIVVPVLEAMRDARWALIAALAEIDRGEEGPVFDDPKALRKHLNALLRD